ncbi:MAG: MBL fold metallo-hydrolase [Planctomycetes bacterium]|nr:MBL fold metallo-hydrolase [Planctomycetota bacterium]
MRIIFLGTGTSHGVPVVGCDCAVCKSPNPKNRRTRTSILISENGRNVLVDASVELRLQCLQNDVRRVDAVLLTHGHADHIFGLDDLRIFNSRQKAVIPVYGSEQTLGIVRKAFSYVFEETQIGGGKPQFTLNPVSGRFRVCDVDVEAIEVFHGRLPVTAYRFGPFAYVTDVNSIPPESFERMRGLDTLVLDALRYRPHSTHFCLDESLRVVAELKPRRAYFTHMAHDLEHDATNAKLPTNVELAYDGLMLEI